ncbi:hypothetical protein GWK47_043158 [Chionoecetes opilio]|uniref:Uncharacterized protein n=1 Tax=Chionoecetes opilio TaxID=41210 RepID=A0A8J4Y838_CHIOP|nr:hypothetical protein GWK47_043158 [Chionoecetes opilio]
MCSRNNNNTTNHEEEEDTAITSSTPSLTCAPVPSPVLSPVVQGLPTPPYSPAPKTIPAQKVGEGVSPRGPSALHPPPPPVASTFKIFVPRTKDMNKGFLPFNGNDSHSTVLKDEPEDLTHLAPSGGGTCVPLPTLIPDLEEDSCMPHDVSTFMPILDMLPLDYLVPVLNTDVIIQSPGTDTAEDQDLSPKYLYEENQIQERSEACHQLYFIIVNHIISLSGGRLLLSRSRCSTPSPGCGGGHPGALGTPEPPKPLLSEAALQPIKKQSEITFASSQPRTTTESIFMPLDETNSGGSSELFGKLDLKFENQSMDSDEFEMRAPYIPTSNELLFWDHEDLFSGAEPEITISPKCFRDVKPLLSHDREDSSLAQLLQDTDPNIAGNSPGRNIQLDHSPGTQRSQYQHSKFLDGDEMDSIGGDPQMADPPPVLVQEPVEPPPPLLGTGPHHTSGQIKRGHSPLSSPTLHHKKLCSPKNQQPLPKLHERSQDALSLQQREQLGGLRLFTPHAPTMQQLLISKDPITVRGGRTPSGGASASRHLSSDKNHSVLRNLLVSGRDESAGYSVSAPASPAGPPSASSATSPGPHPLREEAKGVKNPSEENGSTLLKEGHGGGLPASPAAFRPPRERMATMLLTSAGGKAGSPLPYSTLRIVTGSSSSLKQAFKLTSNSSSHPEGCSSRLGQRQDPYLLMSSDTIPTLLELTQQDYEVNAPNNGLLQGAELLMALDQSSEAALLDGK